MGAADTLARIRETRIVAVVRGRVVSFADAGADRFGWLGQPADFAREFEPLDFSLFVLPSVNPDRILALERAA